jgi:hypothetical protein
MKKSVVVLASTASHLLPMAAVRYEKLSKIDDDEEDIECKCIQPVFYCMLSPPIPPQPSCPTLSPYNNGLPTVITCKG